MVKERISIPMDKDTKDNSATVKSKDSVFTTTTMVTDTRVTGDVTNAMVMVNKYTQMVHTMRESGKMMRKMGMEYYTVHLANLSRLIIWGYLSAKL